MSPKNKLWIMFVCSCFLPYMRVASHISQSVYSSTVGSRYAEQGKILKLLFDRPHFRTSVVPDVATVELCGALKVTHVYVAVQISITSPILKTCIAVLCFR